MRRVRAARGRVVLSWEVPSEVGAGGRADDASDERRRRAAALRARFQGCVLTGERADRGGRGAMEGSAIALEERARANRGVGALDDREGNGDARCGVAGEMQRVVQPHRVDAESRDEL